MIAPDAATADALSGPLYVLGPEAGCRYAAAHPGVEAVWVRDTGGSEEKEDDDEGLDPELVVITDALAPASRSSPKSRKKKSRRPAKPSPAVDETRRGRSAEAQSSATVTLARAGDPPTTHPRADPAGAKRPRSLSQAVLGEGQREAQGEGPARDLPSPLESRPHDVPHVSAVVLTCPNANGAAPHLGCGPV